MKILCGLTRSDRTFVPKEGKKLWEGGVGSKGMEGKLIGVKSVHEEGDF